MYIGWRNGSHLSARHTSSNRAHKHLFSTAPGRPHTGIGIAFLSFLQRRFASGDDIPCRCDGLLRLAVRVLLEGGVEAAVGLSVQDLVVDHVRPKGAQAGGVKEAVLAEGARGDQAISCDVACHPRTREAEDRTLRPPPQSAALVALLLTASHA